MNRHDEEPTPWLAIFGVFIVWLAMLAAFLDWANCTASTPC